MILAEVMLPDGRCAAIQQGQQAGTILSAQLTLDPGQFQGGGREVEMAETRFACNWFLQKPLSGQFENQADRLLC